jgi:hypothetical protein
MKFKYVQTRTVRYSVIIEAPNVDIADDLIFQHEEWNEDCIEECDPPWREECPEDAVPAVYIVAGRILTGYDFRHPPASIPDLDAKPVTVGAEVEYQSIGPRWRVGTITFLYRDLDGVLALVKEGDQETWVTTPYIKVRT